MLETADRLLAKEKDPTKRLEILFRWIKIKEDYETTVRKNTANIEDPALVQSFTQSKNEIVDRLMSELKNFEGRGMALDRLHRELGFRLLEQKRYLESKEQIEGLSKRVPDDELAYGDALLGAKLTVDAIAAYNRASLEARLKTVAAYKRAWAYLSLSEFSSALRDFDTALEDNANSPAKMREEAFKDRLRPFIETFSKPNFEEADAQSLKALAIKIRPVSEASGGPNTLYQDALKSLIQGFNAKNDVKKAEQIFSLLIKEVPEGSDEALEVLISAAPLWLQIHRSRLEHNDVEKIILSLPDHEIDIAKATAFHAELNNTAAFYQTLVSDRQDEKQLDPKARNVLLLLYKKYFIFFPKDADADPLRIDYSRLLLIDGDAESCLQVLGARFKKDSTVENIALGLEAQCELKHLDQLYARTHDDNFYQKLDQGLVKTKLYKRSEIGVPEVQAFQSLTQMLIGAIKKNQRSPILRSTLKELIAEYPYGATDHLLRDLKIISSELQFEDLAVADLDPNEKAKQFFEIHKATPLDTEVALKSIRNSIILTTDREGLERCDLFQKHYFKDFTLNSEVHTRCLGLAERHLLLEKELAYWKLYENQLDDAQKIRLALLELSLGFERAGNARLNALKSDKSKVIQDFWYGNSQPKPTLNPKIVQLEQSTDQFVKGLRKVAFAKIAKVVPIMISNYKEIDRQWLKATKLDGDKALATARVLSARALIAARMRDWMKTLPEPAGLTDDELQLYREKTVAVLKPWEDLAEQTLKECSESAYALSPEFESTASCPEATLATTWNQLMGRWEQSRQAPKFEMPWSWSSQTDEETLFKTLVEAGTKEKNSLRARYFLIRAYDMAKEPREKATIQLAMAKVLDRDRFWRAAAELDGNLVEPILWLKTRSNGNPFYERLYDTQIDLIMKRERFEPIGGSASIDPQAKF